MIFQKTLIYPPASAEQAQKQTVHLLWMKWLFPGSLPAGIWPLSHFDYDHQSITTLMSPLSLTSLQNSLSYSEIWALLAPKHTLGWTVHYQMEIDAASVTCSQAFKTKKKVHNILLSGRRGENREENGMRNRKHMVCRRILMRLICFRNTLSSNLMPQRLSGLQTLSGLVGRP